MCMNNTNTKAVKNCKELVQAAVAELKANGWTEAEIIPKLSYLASEAVKFLAAK